MQNKPNQFKESKFYRNFKENRAVYITAITLLVALAVIVAVTAVANRSKKPTLPPNETESGTETNAPETNTPETDSPSTDVMDTLPTFTLPVSGNLLKGHDATTQVFSNTMGDYRVHLGLDIASEEGAPVMVAADGTVAEVWEDAMMGHCVAVKHSGDTMTIYKNLAETLAEGVKAGTKLSAGDTIGYVGESAMVEMAEEPHLHFELTVAGINEDPLKYFDEQTVATLAQDNNYEANPEE